MIRRLLVLVFSVLLLALLAGCSGSKKPVGVDITASDFGYTSSLTSFEQGVPYHFVVTNNGSIAHELMIMKPMETAGTMEEMDEMALTLIEEEDLQPGQTATLDYTFTEAYPSGSLEFACHIEGHYEAGMHLSIIVK
jgi:uncharacterized cupredoxin-like copper-binding protein